MALFEPIALKDDDATLVDVLIVPDGQVETGKGKPSFSLREDDFEKIVARFRERRVNLVIDYEHQTLGGGYSSPDGTAPAAGWIHDIRYEQGRGIVAKVEWTPRARKLIRAGEYRYLSPVLRLSEGDDGMHPYELEHAAVTNNPAIHGMERLAASRSEKETKRMSDNQVKFEPHELMQKLVWAFQEATPEEQAAVSADVVEQVDEVGVALANLKNAMGLPDGSTPVQIIQAAIDMVGGGAEDEGGEDEGDMAASRVPDEVCEALSLNKGASAKDVVKEIDRMRATSVSADEHKAVLTRLEVIEADHRDRNATALVERFVAEGRLNPHDEKKMQWALSRAKSDATAFTELMEGAPTIMPTDRVSDDTETKGHAERERLIATAVSDHKRLSVGRGELAGIARYAYVNEVLRDKNHSTLTKAEREKLGEEA